MECCIPPTLACQGTKAKKVDAVTENIVNWHGRLNPTLIGSPLGNGKVRRCLEWLDGKASFCMTSSETVRHKTGSKTCEINRSYGAQRRPR